MKHSSTPFAAALLMAISACASSPGSGDDSGEDDGALQGSGDEQPEPGCTPATDTVPLDDIAAHMDLSDITVGEMARGHDGTVYFIQNNNETGAAIGRRLPCKPVEDNWFVTPLYVHELVVSSDNFLYIAAGKRGGNVTPTAELYRFDLSSGTSTPKLLLSTQGQKLGTLSAGLNGRVFFTRWTETQSFLGYVENGAVKVPWTLGGGFAGIIAKPDGSAAFYRSKWDDATSSYSKFVGTFRVNANGTATVTEQAVPANSAAYTSLGGNHSDVTGGVYILAMSWVYEGPFNCSLYHAKDLLSPRTLVAEVRNVTTCATSFAVDGDATSAAIVATGEHVAAGTTPGMTAVTLPIAAMP